MRIKSLKRLAEIISKYPVWIVAIALVLTFLSAFVTIKKLRISADYYDMISDSRKYKRDYVNFTREFGDTEMIYVVIEVEEHPERAKKFADALSIELAKFQNDIKKIFFKIDYTKFGRNILLFLDPATITQLKNVLTKNASGVKMMAEMKDLNDLLKIVNENLERNLRKNLKNKVTREGVEELKKWITVFRYINARYVDKYISENVQKAREQKARFQSEYQMLKNIIQAFILSFERGAVPESLFAEIMTAPELKQLIKGVSKNQDGYLFTDNGKLLLMMILPNKNMNELNIIKEPLRKMREALAQTLKKFPGVKAGITGRVVLQADEMNTSNSDMAKASIISLFIVTILFMLFFKNLPRPLLTSLALIVAIGLTFGVATITVGHLTILSIVFTVILIGLGIDFGVHILSRYKAELQGSQDVKKAIETTLLSTGKANVTSAISISAAFFAGMLTGFKGLEELGFIGGMGIVITFICMIVVLPALLCLYDRKKHQEKKTKTFILRFTLFRHFIKKPLLVLSIAVLLTGGLFFFVLRVHFNLNLTQLQAEGLESVEYEHKLTSNSNFSSWFGAFIVNDIQKVKAYEAKLRKLSMVGEVHSIFRVIPQNQATKIRLLSELRKRLGPITVTAKRTDIDFASFQKNLKKMQEYFQLSYELLKVLGDRRMSDLQKTLESLTNMLKRLDGLVHSRPHAKKLLLQIQKAFFENFSRQLGLFIKGLHPTGITENNLLKTLPQDILDRFVSARGNYLIYAYSPYDLWEGNNMEKFVGQLRTVDPNVTGIAVLNAENRVLMMRGFKRAALFAFIIVFIIIFVDFKNAVDSLFALIPMIFGLLWLLIIMGIFRIPLNFANFFAIPILIGIGIENGVQLMHRFKERGDFAIAGKSTGTGVILTALTTIAGFGTLLIAKHKGVFSLGLVMSIGVFTCLMAAMIVLPVMLKLFYPKKRIVVRCPVCYQPVEENTVKCPKCHTELDENLDIPDFPDGAGTEENLPESK